MSNETYVTIRGFVGAVPAMYGNEVNRSTVVIRVGVTARTYNREAGEYQSGTTAWYSVRCYGALGTNVARCVRKGTPVLVRGRLVPRSWTDKHDQMHIEFNILADSIGIELGTGIANFIHTRDGDLAPLEGEPANAGGGANPAAFLNGTGPSSELGSSMPGMSVASGSFDAGHQDTGDPQPVPDEHGSEEAEDEKDAEDGDDGTGQVQDDRDLWRQETEAEDTAGNLSQVLR